MGVFEIEQFAVGTNKIAKILADIDAVKVVACAAVNQNAASGPDGGEHTGY